MCLSDLQKARFLRNLPIEWLTGAVLAIADGLSNAQIRSLQPPNLIRFGDLVPLLRNPPHTGRIQPDRLSFLCLFAKSTV